MFQHTVDRATRLATIQRTVVVAASHHRQEVEGQLLGRPVGKVVWQPANRDTAAGIFLPLAYLRSCAPDATVVIYPSDHFIYPEQGFLDHVRQAARWVEALHEKILLLGIRPDRLETEYGWIGRGPALAESQSHSVHAVSSFHEKPSADLAEAALRAGALWNTLILVAKLETLWRAAETCLPDMIPLFDRLAPVWDSGQEPALLKSLYRDMPAYNFSSHLLQRLPNRVAVMELDGVLWSDWGKPERIAETLRRINKRPAFPPHCLDRPFVPNPQPQCQGMSRTVG
jgi:mannose-1-phosphate guanylyltransferase